MPPAVAAVAAWAAKIVVSDLVINALIYTAISFTISKLLTPKQKSGASKSMEANYYNSEQRVPIIVGYARVGGMEVIPPITTGGHGQTLHRILAVAGHEVSSYGSIMFDTTTVPQANIREISQTHSSGYVDHPNYYNPSIHQSYANVRCYRGTATDSLDFIINFADAVSFDSEFRGRGIAKVMFRYRYNSNMYKGVPQHTMYVSGAKVYDPRDGAQSPTDETTWLWRKNPALIAAWYCVKWGGYDATTEIDWDSVEVAADVCDESVVIPSSTQARYTCNGMLFAHTNMREFQDNLDLIVESMLGAVVYANGKWSFYAGGWETPAETIPETAWLSPPHVVLEGGADKRHNRLHCWYIDPERNWQRVECYPRYNATYAAADGGILDHEFDQPLCTNEWEAQRKAELLLRQTRNQVIVSGQLGPQYQNLSVNQTVQLDMGLLGWEAKTFRVVNFTLNPEGTVNVTLQEEQSTDWTDLTESDYNVPSYAPIPTNETPLPSAPTALITNQLVPGTIQFTIGAPEHVPRETSYRILSSPYSNGLNAGSYEVLGDATALTMTLTDSYWSHTRYYWAQSMRANTPGGVYPSTYGLPVFINPPADNTLNNAIVPDHEFSVGTAAYWTWSHAPFATFEYQPALTGGTDGGGRITCVQSLGGRPSYTLRARPHPNHVSSFGVPVGVGYAAYEAHIRWRVNTFTALGSYHTNSGGYFYPVMYRVDESNTDRYVAYPPAAYTLPNLSAMQFFSTATPGTLYDTTFYMAFGAGDGVSFRGFDYAALAFQFNDGDTTTQIDIDRFIVRPLGGMNIPLGTPANIASPMALITLGPDQFINEIQAAVGSVGFRVGNHVNWPIGVSAFCGKPRGAALSWIYTENTSFTLTLAGLTTTVNTLAMTANAAVTASVKRVSSWNYIVSGDGIT